MIDALASHGPAAPEQSGESDAANAALCAQLARQLETRGWMLATAESCTGGLIAGACTELAGSSAWFDRGFVTYSNEAKREMLGVPADLLAAHGAVSEPVARAMADGALVRAETGHAARGPRVTVTVAVTGIAGPTGGSAAKPVGTVCFGFSVAGVSHTETQRFAGDRAVVRQATVRHALVRLVALLQEQSA